MQIGQWNFIEFVVGVYFNSNRAFKQGRRSSQLDIRGTHAYAGTVGDACNLAIYGQNIKAGQYAPPTPNL